MKKKKNETRSPLLRLTGGILVVLLICRFISSFFPESRLWGVNHAGFIDGMVLIYPVLLLTALLIVLHSKRRAVFFPAMTETAGYRARSHYLHILVILAGSTACFVVFSAKTYFLGDGYQVISWLSSPNLGLKSRAYGEMLIHQLAAQLLGGTDEGHVIQSFRYLSIISGMIYVSSIVHYGRQITEDRFSYHAFILLNLLVSSAILFFGYVELYSLTLAAISIFLLSGLSALKNSRKSVVPVVAFAVALFLHRLSLIFTPGLLLYLFLTYAPLRYREKLCHNRRVVSLVLLAGFLCLYVLALTTGPLYWRQAFLPPFGGRFTTDNYYLLSMNHLIDYVNLLLLMIPITLAVWFCRWAVPQRQKVEPPAGIFLTSVVIYGMLAAFIIEPQLGMARDWDIMAIALIGTQLAGAYYWVTYYGRNRYFQPASILTILLCLAVFIPWLSLHNSGDALYSYARSLVLLDSKHGRTGLEFLILYNIRRGNKVEAQQLQAIFHRQFPEKQNFMRGTMMLEQKKYMQAEQLYLMVLKENPAIYMPYVGLGRVYLETGQYRRALDYFSIADGLNPYNAENSYYLGLVHERIGEHEKAVWYWRRSLRYDRNNALSNKAIGKLFHKNRQYDSAVSYLNMSVHFDSTGDAWYYLGMSELQRGDTIKALENFRKYLPAGQTDSLFKKIQSVRRNLGATDSTAVMPGRPKSGETK
ncbi:MAG: tetratricopeptide repeat protein [Candidatus Zixiibacteriota bacterium]|nr:MAG: tetratricopeptide repeat protein [candidate division Zixibacteria bacterium]